MFLCSTFFLSLQCFWMDWQNIFACLPSMCNQYCTYFVVALANDRMSAFWNFQWEHDVLRAFEKIVMVEVSEHVEFCSSTTKNISTIIILMVTKLGRMGTFLEGDPHKKSHDPLIMWSCKVTWQIKNITITIMLMATKLGRVVTYLERRPPKKLHNPLITWPCKDPMKN